MSKPSYDFYKPSTLYTLLYEKMKSNQTGDYFFAYKTSIGERPVLCIIMVLVMILLIQIKIMMMILNRSNVIIFIVC